MVRAWLGVLLVCGLAAGADPTIKRCKDPRSAKASCLCQDHQTWWRDTDEKRQCAVGDAENEGCAVGDVVEPSRVCVRQERCVWSSIDFPELLRDPSDRSGEKPIGQGFGWRVAASSSSLDKDGMLVVGVADKDALVEQGAGRGIQGRAHIYNTKTGERADLVSDQTDDSFGAAVALGDKWLVVGAPTRILDSDAASGAVWVCLTALLLPLGSARQINVTEAEGHCTRIDPTTVTESTDGAKSGPRFGTSVATDGDNIVVADMTGRVWVFNKPDLSAVNSTQEFNVTLLETVLYASPSLAIKENASPSLAIKESRILVGAHHWDTGRLNAPGAGQGGAAVYKFEKSEVGEGGGWKLVGNVTVEGNGLFGTSVAMLPSSDGFVVGAPRAGPQVSYFREQSGAVYVYQNWTSNDPVRLVSTDPSIDDKFGYSVATYNYSKSDVVVVGAYLDSKRDFFAGAAGTIYLYRRLPTGEWQASKVTASDDKLINAQETFLWFGYSVTVSDDKLVVGIPNLDSSSLETVYPNAWKIKEDQPCSVFCRQGWPWEDQGKPACCQETRNSPYDNCEYESCSCDAICRSCCDSTYRAWGAVVVYDLKSLLKCDAYQTSDNALLTFTEPPWLRTLLELGLAAVVIAVMVTVYYQATTTLTLEQQPEPEQGFFAELTGALKKTFAELTGADESRFSFSGRRGETLPMQIDAASPTEAYQVLQVLSSTSGSTVTTMLVQQLQAVNHTGPMPSMVTTVVQSVTEASSGGSSSDSSTTIIAVAIVVAAALVLVVVLFVSGLVYMYKLTKNEAPAGRNGAVTAPPVMGTVGVHVSINPVHN